MDLDPERGSRVGSKTRIKQWSSPWDVANWIQPQFWVLSSVGNFQNKPTQVKIVINGDNQLIPYEYLRKIRRGFLPAMQHCWQDRDVMFRLCCNTPLQDRYTVRVPQSVWWIKHAQILLPINCIALWLITCTDLFFILFHFIDFLEERFFFQRNNCNV